MTFTGNEDHRIDLEEAIELTKRYRDSGDPKTVLAGFFGRKALIDILAQPDCVGIRIYYGLNSDNKPALVLVGAAADQKDLYHGLLAEYSLSCPPYCDLASPLVSQ